MQISRLVLYVSLVSGAQYATAQDVSHADLSEACIGFNRTALDLMAGGLLADAEFALSGALGSTANGLGQSCTWVLLHNIGVVVDGSGRFVEAEVFAERTLKTLAKDYPPDDPILLRPLQFLASVRFEQRKLAKCREAYTRMLSIRTERAEDRGLIHGIAGALLQAEGRYNEAESEYLAALSIQEALGRGDTAKVAGILAMLGDVYIEEGRFPEAAKILDRALSVFDAGGLTVPMERIKILHSRASMHIRLRQWKRAEEDLLAAISTADRYTRLDSVELNGLLDGYAFVLRKNHKSREARSIEVRAAALPKQGLTNNVVDASELQARPKTPHSIR